MTRKPIRWVDALNRIFSPVRKKPRSARLAVEQLCDRINPVTFNPSADVADGAPNSLRDVITQANASTDTNVVINLDSLGVYLLTLANNAGQDNSNIEGDLDIENFGTAATKTYSFVGVGGNTVFIAQTQLDRVFHIIGSNAVVRFSNVTITGGHAVDDGTLLATPGETDAWGGGILNEGAQLFFSGAVVTQNVAGQSGSSGVLDGADGSSLPGGAGADGLNGKNAYGGGLYSAGGTISIRGDSAFASNIAGAGRGGNGGNGGSGGNGGDGGQAFGGGIYAAAGDIIVDAVSFVSTNAALGGVGGNGGAGSTAIGGGTGGSGGAAFGGGIYTGSGNVTVTGLSLVALNNATGGDGGAGGFGAFAGGVGGDAGDAHGGAVYAVDGDISVQRTSIVAANQASGGDGGDGGNANMANGFGGFGGNGAASFGGGLFIENGDVVIDTSARVTSNVAAAGPGGNGGAGQVPGAGGFGAAASGGGIYVQTGSVTVQSVGVVADNGVTAGTAASGGGIYVGEGDVTIDSGGAVGSALGFFGGNSVSGAAGFGAGIYAGSGTVLIDNGSVNGNTVAGSIVAAGGGIYSASGNITIDSNSSVSSNTVTGFFGGDALGGGIHAVNGFVTVDNGSSVDNNSASGGDGVNGAGGTVQFPNGSPAGDGGIAAGGGVYVVTGGVIVDNLGRIDDNNLQGGDGGIGGTGFLSANGAIGGAGGGAFGGGVWIDSGDVTLTNISSISNNTAQAGAGGTGGFGGAGVAAAGGIAAAGGAGGAGQGGGIWIRDGDTFVSTHSRVDSNFAVGGSGGAGGEGGDALGAFAGGAADAGGEGGIGQGGGIYSGPGTVTINSASVSSNSAVGARGGAGGTGGTGNASNGNGGNGGDGGDSQGGGIFIADGSLSLNVARIDANEAGGNLAAGGAGGARGGAGAVGGNGGDGGNKLGGGLYLSADAVSVTIFSSSITNNIATAGGAGGAAGAGGGVGGLGGDVRGGGIYSEAANISISNSTIALNSARSGGTALLPIDRGDSRGGGVFILSGAAASIGNSTVARNVSTNEGAGIRNEGDLDLVSTLVSNNNSLLSTEIDLSSTGSVAAEFTLIQTAAGHTIVNGVDGNIVGVDSSAINLDTVLTTAANGTRFLGFTDTSVAFNAGSNPDDLLNDQRGTGFSREFGGTTDIGAIEGKGVGTIPLAVASTKGGFVRLVNPVTGEVLQEWQPFSAGYKGVVNVALGDINNDGYADIICTTRGARNGRVFVYDGKAAMTPGVDFADPSTWPTFLTPATGLTDPRIANFKAFNSTYKGGLTVAAGDVNGDGFADIVVGTSVGSPGRVAAYSGQTQIKIGTTITVFSSAYKGGVNVAVGDVDGDENADIIAGSAGSRMAQAKVFGWNGTVYSQLGTTFTPFGSTKAAVQVAAIDTDGDGVSEIALAIKSGSTVQVQVLDIAANLLGTYEAANGVTQFAISKIDLDQDGDEELVIGQVPSTTPQFRVLDPLTGVEIPGTAFNAFGTLTGALAVAGL